jgi:hypothetical protein
MESLLASRNLFKILPAILFGGISRRPCGGFAQRLCSGVAVGAVIRLKPFLLLLLIHAF